jgi:hypothetical protein
MHPEFPALLSSLESENAETKNRMNRGLLEVHDQFGEFRTRAKEETATLVQRLRQSEAHEEALRQAATEDEQKRLELEFEVDELRTKFRTTVEFADGLFKAGENLGIRVFGYGAGGCPMRSRSTVKAVEWCPQVQNAYLLAVERGQPRIVVFANRYDQYAIESIEFGANDLRVPFANGRYPVNRDEQIESIVDSLVEQITLVRNLGPKVVVLLETPTVAMNSQTIYSKYVRAFNSKERASIKEFNKVRDGINQIIRSRIGVIAGVTVVDPKDYLCEKYPDCSAVVNGNIAYWEKQHLNRYGSLMLTPLWEIELSKVNEEPRD